MQKSNIFSHISLTMSQSYSQYSTNSHVRQPDMSVDNAQYCTFKFVNESCLGIKVTNSPAGRLSDGPGEQFLSGTLHRPLLLQQAASTPVQPAAPALKTHLVLSDVPQYQTSVTIYIKKTLKPKASLNTPSLKIAQSIFTI